MADPFSASRPDPRSRPRRRQRPNAPDIRLDVRTSTVEPGVVIVTVAGEIDLANQAELTSALTAAAGDPGLRLLVCDFSQVTFLACTGVAGLLDLKSELDDRGAELRLVATDPTVLRVLQVTGQHDVLGVRPHLSAALTGFVEQPIAPVPTPTLAHLRTSLDEAVEQTSSLAELCGRLADELAAVDAARIVDERGGQRPPQETLADMTEDLRTLQNHLTTGAMLAAPAVEDLGHLRDDEPSTQDGETSG